MNEFDESNGKVEKVFNIPIESDNHVPSIHFPLDEIYVIGHGNLKFSVYAKRDVKLTLDIPEVENDKIPVLINDTKITQDLQELYLVATFIKEKEVKTIFAQFDLESGKTTNVEIFKSAATPRKGSDL